MMLADLGADVIRVDRSPAGTVAAIRPTPPADLLNRGRRSVGVDLKNPEGVETVLELVERADALIEGFRPGVTERLGLGPDVCLARNPRLVYGRMTGWGQDGPVRPRRPATTSTTSPWPVRSSRSVGRASSPTPPINLVGDFGGGGMLLAFGVVLPRWSRPAVRAGPGGRRGHGRRRRQPHDHDPRSFRHMGIWNDERGTNMLDTGAHFYDVYETADGEYVSIGSIEPQFYAELLRAHRPRAPRSCPARWTGQRGPSCKERLAAVFRTKTRDEWCEIMEGTDVCFAPVLTMDEAPEHPHIAAPGHVHRGRRRGPAGAGAPLQPHAGRDRRGRRRTPASTPTRSWPSWGFGRRADRRAPRRPARSLTSSDLPRRSP